MPEGTAVIVFPRILSGKFNHGSLDWFDFDPELPSSLHDTLPSTLFRSHMNELNQLLSLASDRRCTLWRWMSGIYMAVVIALIIIAISLAGVSILLENDSSFSAVLNHLTRIIGPLSLFCAIILLALKPYLTRIWIQSLLSSLDAETRIMVGSWNARAPPFIRFRIIGLGKSLSSSSSGVRHQPQYQYHRRRKSVIGGIYNNDDEDSSCLLEEFTLSSSTSTNHHHYSSKISFTPAPTSYFFSSYAFLLPQLHIILLDAPIKSRVAVLDDIDDDVAGLSHTINNKSISSSSSSEFSALLIQDDNDVGLV